MIYDITYDASVDALYITVVDNPNPCTWSEEKGSMVVDYDHEGGLTGIEILRFVAELRKGLDV